MSQRGGKSGIGLEGSGRASGKSQGIELSGRLTPDLDDLNPNDFRSKKKPEHQPLIEEKDEMDEHEGKIGLLLSAASRNHLQKMLSLIRSGIRPDSADYDKRTALHLAASEGHLAAIKLLIDEGANVNVKDRFGHTPLDDAAKAGYDEIVSHLQANGARFGSISELEAELITAAALGNLTDVQRLLSTGKSGGQGLTANCCDYDKRYPLHLAVANGHYEVVKELLNAKADPNVTDRWGLSPLEDALRRATRVGTDPMKQLFLPFLKEAQSSGWTKFVVFFVLWEIVMIALFGVFARYEETADGTSNPRTFVRAADLNSNAAGDLADAQLQVYYPSLNMYPLFQDVHVMIFIGFGYLMTFLRKNGYGAVGLTFLVGCFTLQWYMLCHCFWEGAFTTWTNLYINVFDYLVTADFCAGAVLITYGVLLGKVSPFQLLFIALSETVWYALNERISIKLGISDIGGTMVIHMFGAWFGMACAVVLGHKVDNLNKADNAAVYHSDIFAMIGTVFLWMFWPSFNGATGNGPIMHRAIINTLLSLCGSVTCAFLTSHALRQHQKFCMVDVQNATLAGGVAMGTCASMVIYPASAIGIGCFAGILSVVGYIYIQPWLEGKFGLHDTCGVNNLHGMPSMVGAIAGIIAAGAATSHTYSADQLLLVFPEMSPNGDRTPGFQALYQFIFICITIGIGTFTGLLTGWFARADFFDPLDPRDGFIDQVYWEVPEMETPYYFDRRGEISREPAQQTTKDGRRPSFVPALSPHHGGPMMQNTKELEQRIVLLEAAIQRGDRGLPPSKSRERLGGMASDVNTRRMESMLETILRKVETLESHSRVPPALARPSSPPPRVSSPPTPPQTYVSASSSSSTSSSSSSSYPNSSPTARSNVAIIHARP